jgi:predicted ester cyclase
MGIPATGKQVNINGMTCSRFENGQIIEEWEMLDQLTMFRQLDIVSI